MNTLSDKKDLKDSYEENLPTIVLPADDKLSDLSTLFKIFGDQSRIKIMFAILDRGLSAGQIAKIASMSQSAVSHQLRLLKTNRLVKYHRVGRSIIYSLSDEHVAKILSIGLEHSEE